MKNSKLRFDGSNNQGLAWPIYEGDSPISVAEVRVPYYSTAKEDDSYNDPRCVRNRKLGAQIVARYNAFPGLLEACNAMLKAREIPESQSVRAREARIAATKMMREAVKLAKKEGAK